MGTLAYMPPEQARGRWEEVDGRSDLWSVGAMMFVALSRRPLRTAATRNEELLDAMTQPAPPLLSVAPTVPPRLADVVDRALALDKLSRWPTARDMQLALGALLGTTPVARVPLAVTERSFEPKTPPRAAKRRIAFAALALALTIGVSIAVWPPRTRRDRVSTPPLASTAPPTVERPPPTPSAAGALADLPRPGGTSSVEAAPSSVHPQPPRGPRRAALPEAASAPTATPAADPLSRRL
jgi:serine/threonine-protein kinase